MAGSASFLDERALLKACAIEATPFVRPHASQGLHTIKPLLLDYWRQRGPADSVVVLAVDGIAFDVAAAIWSPDVFFPITSTFPSTSSTAWATALTGMTANEHGIPGVVYYDPGRAALYNCLADSVLVAGGEWRRAAAATGPEPAPLQTIFAEISSDGADCVANPGDFTSLSGCWVAALLAGARVCSPIAAQETIRMHPRAMVELAIVETERALERHTHQIAPLFVWTYINLDEYVHLHGYDGALTECLRRLETASREWTRRGSTVIAHSDHGLVPNYCNETLDAAWHAANTPSDCRHPPGGAGRVLWCYPRPGRENQVFDRVSGILGEKAVVWSRDELAYRNVLAIGPALEKMIGEIVVLATGEHFPAPGGRPFEHGSMLPGEMLTVVAIWAADTRMT